MNEQTKEILGEKVTKSINDLMFALDIKSLTPEQMAERIADMPEVVRSTMQIVAEQSGNEILATNLDKANTIIIEDRIQKFKKTVKEGTSEQYLSNLDWTDLMLLKVHLGLYDVEVEKKTSEDKWYTKILDKAINEKVEKETPKSKKMEIER